MNTHIIGRGIFYRGGYKMDEKRCKHEPENELRCDGEELSDWEEDAMQCDKAMRGCIENGHYSEAMQHAIKWKDVLARELPQEHLKHKDVHLGMALICNRMGNVQEEIKHLHAALAINEKNNVAPLDVAFEKFVLGQAYYKDKNYETALKEFRQSLQIRENELPVVHPEIALVQYWVGEVLFKLGSHIEAISYYNDALQARERVLQPNHPLLEETHMSLWMAYQQLGELDDALQHALSTLRIKETNLTCDHQNLSLTNYNLGVLYMMMERQHKAILHIKKALEINEKHGLEENMSEIDLQKRILVALEHLLGREQEESESIESDLDELITERNEYIEKTEYNNALRFQKRILDIVLNTAPQNLLDIANEQYYMGMIYTGIDQYASALPCFMDAAATIEKCDLSDIISTAEIYHMIGFVCFHLAHEHLASKSLSIERMDMSLRYFRRAYEIREQELHSEHPDTILSQHWIGEVLARTFHPEEALRYLLPALEARKRIQDAHEAIAGSHCVLAIAYSELAQYEKALLHAQESLRIRKDYLPPNHLDIAESHSGVGKYLSCLGRHADALQSLEASLSIKAANGSADAIEVAETLHSAGWTCLQLHKYEEALRYLTDALSIYESWNTSSFESIIARIHYRIAHAHDRLGQWENVVKHFRVALNIWEAKKQDEDSKKSNNVDIIYMYYDVAIQDYDLDFKNHLLERMREHTHSFMQMMPIIYKNIMKIQNEQYRLDMLRQAEKGMSCINSVACSFPAEIDKSSLYELLLRTKDISFESEIIQLKIHFTEEQKDNIIVSHMQEMTAAAVLKYLPRDFAMLEFGWFNCRQAAWSDFHAMENQLRPLHLTSGKYFVYFLLNGEITLHYINETESIVNDLIYAVRKKITNTDSNCNLAPLNCDTELSALYKLLMKPFEGSLHGINHLYIAPEGELFKLPFELLQDDDGMKLSDKLAISYISTGRDIIRILNNDSSSSQYTSAAIIADPLYELPKDTEQSMTIDDDGMNGKRSIVTRQSRDLRKLSEFKPLVFGKIEADAIEKVFGGKKDTRYRLAAKKSTLGEIGSPDIIHVVTHGFALEEEGLDIAPLKTLLGSQGALDSKENPMVRCGLVFSGVNDWIKSDKTEPLSTEFGEGILNAKEALSLELRNTELLVLSACQTGFGEVKNGEGIKGLRRSFELAGVRTILCTLWEVNDNSSAILMEQFYVNLIEKGMSKLKALSDAKKYVRSMTYAQLIDYYKSNDLNDDADALNEKCELPSDLEMRPFEHPYFWAGYILQGDMGEEPFYNGLTR